MDPDANVREQWKLAQQMVRDYENPSGNGIDQDDANRLAELVIAKHRWGKDGGFESVPDRLATIADVYQAFLDETQTFEDCGEALAYLFGAIASGGKLELTPGQYPQFRVILGRMFKPSHDVWKYIKEIE